MKKNLLTLIIAAATIFMSANANAQQFRANIVIGNRASVQQAFYYYPSANVYFNIKEGEYAYRRRDGIWVTSYQLPERFRIANTGRFVVYHNGFDVWAENRMHIMNFERYGRPEIAYQSYSNQGYYNEGYRDECR